MAVLMVGRDRIVSRYFLSTGPGWNVAAVSARLRLKSEVAIAGLCGNGQVDEVASDSLNVDQARYRTRRETLGAIEPQ